ncbi:MAG: hypothetical protein ABL921_27155 [Pirellula sp.]
MPMIDVVRTVWFCAMIVVGAMMVLALFFRLLPTVSDWAKTWARAKSYGGSRPRRRSKISPSKSRLRSKPRSNRRRELLAVDRGSSERELRTGIVERELQTGVAERELRTGVAERGLRTGVAERELQTGVVERELRSNSATCEPRRCLSVHLVTGEVLEGVRILSKERADSVRDELGYPFDGAMVVQDDEEQTWIIREQNIKMVSWTNEFSKLPSVRTTQETNEQNGSRGGWPIRRTVP